MTTVNNLTLIGYLGGNPEIRYLNDGGATTTVSIATSDYWKDKAGNPQTRTEWHQVVFFRRLAEILGEYAHKGSLVYVTGPIRKRTFINKDQVEKSVFEIHARSLKILSRKDMGEAIDDVPDGQDGEMDSEEVMAILNG